MHHTKRNRVVQMDEISNCSMMCCDDWMYFPISLLIRVQEESACFIVYSQYTSRPSASEGKEEEGRRKGNPENRAPPPGDRGGTRSSRGSLLLLQDLATTARQEFANLHSFSHPIQLLTHSKSRKAGRLQRFFSSSIFANGAVRPILWLPWWLRR